MEEVRSRPPSLAIEFDQLEIDGWFTASLGSESASPLTTDDLLQRIAASRDSAQRIKAILDQVKKLDNMAHGTMGPLFTKQSGEERDPLTRLLTKWNHTSYNSTTSIAS